MEEDEHALTKTIAKVCGINIGVLMIYSAFCYLVTQTGSTENIGYMIFMMGSVGLHTAGCFIASLVFLIMGRGNYALAFLLSAFLVGVVGFSFCYGGAL